MDGGVVAVRGVILTGRLGVGKTTALVLLRQAYGVVVPQTTTTRTVSSTDVALCHLPVAEFTALVRAGRLQLPMIAGRYLYAWDVSELDLIRTAPRVAIAVRPYTALLISAFVPDLQPVWLDVDEGTREQRLLARSEDRDDAAKELPRRRVFDSEDARYQPFFTTVVDASNEEHLMQGLREVLDA